MKNYNKSFSVEITANMIADKLMSNLDPKLTQDRAEKFVDCIIGPMCANDNTHGMKHLYYGLFDLDMEAPKFKEDDHLICSKKIYNNVLVKNKDEDITEATYEQNYEKMGECALVGFDPYRKDTKYQVAYPYTERNGTVTTKHEWVSEGLLEVITDDHVPESTGE